MRAISVRELEYGYTASEKVLEDLSMEVPQGSIYAFLGANGEGKSTTIRNILGLLKPNNGEIELLGEKIDLGWNGTFSKVGSMIETPSLYMQMTGREHLKMMCKYRQVSLEKVNSTLEMVGLEGAASKKVKAYSTGMKQRLGLGMAIVHDPDLVILDEPTNGLDPSGILEMRKILKRISGEGRTIFLSSHILSEVEKVATHLGVLAKGRLVFEGSMEEMQDLKLAHSSRVKCSDVNRAKELLGKYEVKVIGANAVEVAISTEEQNASVVEILVRNGVKVYEVRNVESDLEKLFLALTNEESE